MLHAMRPVLLATALLAVTAHAFLGFGSGSARNAADDAKWGHYHNQEQLETKLNEINEKCPEISTLYEIGKSVEGRSLVVIHFSTTPGEHVPTKPEVKLIGNMHGNEPIGRELLLRFAENLCDGAINNDKEVIQLLNSTSIHILPSMNPDGFELALSTEPAQRQWLTGRANINGVDLNRDFPDLDSIFYELQKIQVPKFDHLLSLFDDNVDRQPETIAVGQWTLSLPFVLSANFHEGDLVANYPFDAAIDENSQKTDYSASPDDGTFRWLAKSYADNHAHMSKNDHAPCDGSSQDAFARQGGITNGAKWYSVAGGMQDFNYLATNAMEITLELSCEKMPAGSQLPQFWEDNKKSIFEYVWKSHSGIKGLVVDATTGEPIYRAVVWIRNGTETVPIKHPVTTWSEGDYYRILPAGQYEVIVAAEGYDIAAKNVTIENKVRDSALVVNFALSPSAEQPSENEQEKIAELVDEITRRR
uniref:Peptidase_M14 domain-containing protein n=1 Tax=Caenorhabditis tropicalis TaxID=1561998 RepID=A0A1I7UH66_9PELO